MPVVELSLSRLQSLVGKKANKKQILDSLPFLGLDALTSISAAQLALKYDLPMIPAYGIRINDENAVQVIFEAPIAHTDSVTMTRVFNDSLSARILANPDQWYWLLKRWDGT